MSLSKYHDYSTLDRLIDGLIFDMPTRNVSQVRTHTGDVKTEENATIVSVEMPGVSVDNLQVTVNEHVLEVLGKSRSGKEHRYSCYLNSSLHNENDISASLKDGLLELRIGHQQRLQPRTIKVVST